MEYVLIMVFMSGTDRNVETLVVDFKTKTQCTVVLDKFRKQLDDHSFVLSSGCYKK